MAESALLAVAVIFVQQLVTVCIVTQVTWENVIESFVKPMNAMTQPSTATAIPILRAISEPASYIHLASLLNDDHRHVPVSSLLCLVCFLLLDDHATGAQLKIIGEYTLWHQWDSRL